MKEFHRTGSRKKRKPGIVPVYEVGRLTDDRTYYTIKLIEGRRLDKAIDAATALAEKLTIFRSVCATVGFAHSRGVVHLDLKPQNILVAPFGETLVVDWGIARALSDMRRDRAAIAGTPAYMLPNSWKDDRKALTPEQTFLLWGEF